MINKKPWKATRKVTLSSSKSKIKSQIGIIPLKKQETRVEKNKEKGILLFCVSRYARPKCYNWLRNYKSINYFFKKQSENNSGVDSICCERFSVFSTEDIICIYKITKIVRALWLAERRVFMRVCKHGSMT